jgi:hypothetical protein
MHGNGIDSLGRRQELAHSRYHPQHSRATVRMLYRHSFIFRWKHPIISCSSLRAGTWMALSLTFHGADIS